MARAAGKRRAKARETRAAPRNGTGADGPILMTGATGFLGRRLLKKLATTGRTVYLATRKGSFPRLERQIRDLSQEYPGCERRLLPIEADLGAPGLGLDPAVRDRVTRDVHEIFHIAALYDLSAGEQAAWVANVEGTRGVLAIAGGCRDLKKLHHVSTLAVSGDYSGLWYEHMLEAGQRFDNHYARTKFEAERLILSHRDRLPVNVYRPGIVVGDSRTGEMDKIDGPYYFFVASRYLRHLPHFLPLIGPGGGAHFDIVPVDYVVDALFQIACRTDRVGLNFSLTDPHPVNGFEFLNLVGERMGTPRFRVRFPMWPVREYLRLPGVRQTAQAVSKAIGMPYESLFYLSYDVDYDATNTREALEGSGIACPRVTDYLGVLLDYFQREMAK